VTDSISTATEDRSFRIFFDEKKTFRQQRTKETQYSGFRMYQTLRSIDTRLTL